MGIADRDLDWYVRASESAEVEELLTRDASDWARASLEAFAFRDAASSRPRSSVGHLRLHGPGVDGHRIALSHIGSMASLWQKTVSAAGAALEDVKSVRGALSTDLQLRTRLVLVAAPLPGSVVLRVEPAANPLVEAEPDGNVPMVSQVRPLADRAVEALLDVLAGGQSTTPDAADKWAEQLKTMGPRLGGALSDLTDLISRANLTVDARWSEPSRSSLRASLNAEQASWMHSFLGGRGLDSEYERVVGILRTVSDRDQWVLEGLEVGVLRMSAKELDEAVIRQFRVGDSVIASVRTSVIQAPDGSSRTARVIERIELADR